LKDLTNFVASESNTSITMNSPPAGEESDTHTFEFSEQFVCPLCSQALPSIDSVWSHLNGTHTENEVKLPIPPAFGVPPRATETATQLGQYHPNSGYIYGKALNTLERLAAESTTRDETIGRARLQNPYYPFADQGEWELGKYLCETLNRGQITRFLKLEWFKTRDKPVFKSVDELFSWVDSLPKCPRWRCTKIKMEGYVTVHPVFLLWRDGWEVTQVVFGNPVFRE
jgi:hypothetical protein